MPDLLQLYHRLPYPGRVVMASLRGHYLRWWRYGPDTEGLVEAALAREGWSAAQWQAWQEERLARVLHRAATQVPYYRAQWDERRRRGDRASWEVLAHWPVLEKEALRQHPEAFVADDCDRRRMFPEHTSGTTGKSLRLWWSKETVQRWYALYEARARRWYGVSRHDRWAMLGGQLVAPYGQTAPPFWVWNAGLRQLYLSSYHLAPGNVEAYLEALRRYRVTYLLGYPSSIEALARVAQERGLKAPPLQVTVSNAEPLYEHQRAVIEQVFGGPVRNTYGMAEIVCMATECEAGTMHFWPEVGRVEVWRDEAPAPAAAGEAGRFICTGLLNTDMPLVRYAVGDRGRLAPPETPPCACGRAMPVLESVEGRLDDVIVTPDGRRVGRLDPVFKADLPVREAQIVQERPDAVRVRYVPAEGFGARHHAEIVRRLQDRIGAMDITLEAVAQIPRTANGKLRSVISLAAEARRTS